MRCHSVVPTEKTRVSEHNLEHSSIWRGFQSPLTGNRLHGEPVMSLAGKILKTPWESLNLASPEQMSGGPSPPRWGWDGAVAAPGVWELCPLQHYPDERHGGPDRHSRDSRESWGSYGSDRRMSESRGIPPQSRLVLQTPLQNLFSCT